MTYPPQRGLQASASAPPGRFRRIGVAALCLVVFVLSAFVGVLNDQLGVAILTVALLIGFQDAGRSSLGSTIVVSGVALCTLPYVALIYVGHDVQTAWFAMMVIVGLAMVEFSEPYARSGLVPGHLPAELPLIAVYMVVGLLLWRPEGLGQISFYAGWALSLVHLERIHVHSRSVVYRGLGLLVFAAVLGYFTVFLWEGGGRLIYLSFGLAPLFLTVLYGTFRLNVIVLALATAALSFVGRLIRFGWGDGLAGLSVDSGASPITLTSYLWENSDVVLVPGSIYEQWLLLFTNWAPRALWPEKPLGIGSTFVDMYLGRAGLGMEHSTAIGYFGEHLFYLPNFWFVSAGLLTFVVILMRRAIIRSCAPYRAPVIAFDVWLVSMFWGGMAAFAARVWFALLPVLAYMVVIKWLDRKRALELGVAPRAVNM